MIKLDEERIHMENLVNMRFNYLLIILAIIITGVLNSNSEDQARILFICGTIISFGLGWTIIRAYKRFHVLLKKIESDPFHAASFAQRVAKKSCWINFMSKYSAKWVIGFAIPYGVFFFMFIGIFWPKIIYTDTNKIIAELKSENKKIDERLSKIEQYKNEQLSKNKMLDERLSKIEKINKNKIKGN